MNPLLKVKVAPPDYQEGFPDSLDFTTGAQDVSVPLSAGNVATDGTWVCAAVVRADDDNSGDLAVGGIAGSSYPLAPGEFIAIDVPPGVVLDLAKFSVNGLGTSGNVAHFFFVRIGVPR
jgi:hypothetical protein